MNKLKINDEVVVLSGKDKGKKGKILKIYWNQNKVLVEGINVMKKTIRATQEKPEGGIVDRETAIHLSKVACVSPKAGGATRVGIQMKDGKKVRVAKKCGSVLA